MIIQSLDVLFIAAIIIEAVFLFMAAESSWKYFLPLALMILGLVTLGIALLGLAKLGEDNIPLAQFPTVYYVFWHSGALLRSNILQVCGKVPLFATGLANMYYMLHFWLFWGDDFASRFPPIPPWCRFFSSWRCWEV